MADLLFISITITFFVVAALVVRLCDSVIGPDPAVGSDAARDPQTDLDLADAP